MKKFLLLIFFAFSVANAQSLEFVESIGKFNSAVSFYITTNGLIYVTDNAKDEVVLLDTSGNKLKTFGGYGWDENSFDDPSDVFADPLSVYIADKNNHSIKRFDKNLNFISALKKRETENSDQNFGYPVSCATSNQGDLYFVDSENKRIMKFDIYGNFKINFGGLDAGKFQLSNPSYIAISSQNLVYVVDGCNIIVFDAFGNGIAKYSFDKKLNSIRIFFDNLLLTSDDELIYFRIGSHDQNFVNLKITEAAPDSKFVSAIITGSKLYVLTKTSIFIYQIL